jgi:hypothetical protein
MFASKQYNGCFALMDMARAALAVAEPVIREQAENAPREENARLREALKPFAGMAQYCEGMSDSESQCVFVGDLRAARAAILEGGKDE